MEKHKTKTVGIAIIGCGSRAMWVVHELVKADCGKNLRLLSAYDPDPAQLEFARQQWDGQTPVYCKTFHEAIAYPGVDWVMVFSPNVYHREHIEAAFMAGKNVFSEKPLATSINDCQKIYEAHRKSGLAFATGFVLRYSPMYRKAKELLDSGELGDLLAINADENISIQHGTYIMRNWRRHTSEAGPHILEKCCHDLDLINWFCKSVPTRVAAFGSREFFIPKYKKILKKIGRAVLEAWRDPHPVKEDAFSSDKDLLDTQVCCAEFRNGIKVNFMATMSNAMPERRMYFSCTEGTMVLELYSKRLRYRLLNSIDEHVFHWDSEDLHAGGDPVIMKELLEVMLNGGTPKCSGVEGLESAVFAMALDKAMRTRKVVELETTWERLGR